VKLLGRLAGMTLVILAGLAIAAAVLVPRLAGATPYAVLTSSMEPGYPAGTLAVVRPADAENLGVGDVVTYQLKSGQPMTATHRIVAVQHRIDGDLRFVTRGDANSSDDPEPVRPVQIRGEVWYALPYLGHLHRWLPGGQRELAVQAAAAGLLIYAATMFARAWRERRSKEAVR